MKTLMIPSLFLLLLALLAPAAGAVPAPAAPAGAACGDLATPAGPLAPISAEQALGLSPAQGALAVDSPSCCVNLMHQCQSQCRNKGGVAEFDCFPDSCTAACFCVVFP